MQKKCQKCQRSFIARRRSRIFCSVTCANQFHQNHKNRVVLPKKYTLELAELFGILLGDGGVERYFVRVYLNRVADRGYSKRVVSLFQKLFQGVAVTVIDRPRRGTEEVQVSSVDVCDYLRSVGFDPKKRTIPLWITGKLLFTRRAIRGLFDTEGSIGVKKYQGRKGVCKYFQLTVTNKSENILRFLEDGLTKFGYRPTKNSQKNIYISNMKDILCYVRQIGTSNPKLRKMFDEISNNVQSSNTEGC